MKISINEIRQRIDDLKEDYESKLKLLGENATTISIREVSGSEVEKLSADFNFMPALDELNIISKDIAKFKALLAKANSSTDVDEVDTIQSALSKLETRRKLLNKVEKVLKDSKEGKRRRVDGINSPAYIEITSLNFEKPELEAFVKSIKDEINSLELKVSKANETVVEVE